MAKRVWELELVVNPITNCVGMFAYGQKTSFDAFGVMMHKIHQIIKYLVSLNRTGKNEFGIWDH